MNVQQRLTRPEHEAKIDGRTGQVTHCRCGKMLPCPPVAKSENLYGLIPAPFNEDVERVKFRDWYRNDHGSSAEHVPGVWASRTTMIAWNAWLARAKQ